jgi:hypothetical protein
MGDRGVDGRNISACILEEQDVTVWTGLKWLRTGAKMQGLVNTVMNLRVTYEVGNDHRSNCWPQN